MVPVKSHGGTSAASQGGRKASGSQRRWTKLRRAPWSEMDIFDLKNELDRGRTPAETASFSFRDED